MGRAIIVLAFVFLLSIIPMSLAEETTGIITGTVIDSLDNLVENSDIQVMCGATILTAKSNEFGTFIVTQVPLGECRVHARIRDAIGVSEVQVASDAPADVLVKLDKTIISIPQRQVSIWWVALSFLIATAAGIAFVWSRKETQSKVHVQQVSVSTTSTNTVNDSNSEDYPKVRALLSGLSDRERQIVECVMKMSPITQTKLRIETNLPKASLSRNVKKLELKGILHVHRIGSLSRIQIAEQFR